MNNRTMHTIRRTPWLLILVFYIPLILMLAFSFTLGSGMKFIDLRTIKLSSLTLDNYKMLINFGPIITWYANTILYSAIVAIGSGMLAIMGAFAMMQMSTRLRGISLGILVVSLAIPSTVICIPLFLEVHYLGLSGPMAVVLKSLAAPSGIILAWQFLKGMPEGYIESATIDGATDLQIIWNIIIPICKPVFALIVISKGIEFNGDYLWQSINLISKNAQTILVALSNQLWTSVFVVQGGNASNRINIQMAMGVAMFIPIVLIFMLGRKQLLEYTIEGGIKE
jgi:ABC-type glycerol-3-phosphate transport system permease component